MMSDPFSSPIVVAIPQVLLQSVQYLSHRYPLQITVGSINKGRGGRHAGRARASQIGRQHIASPPLSPHHFLRRPLALRMLSKPPSDLQELPTLQRPTLRLTCTQNEL